MHIRPGGLGDARAINEAGLRFNTRVRRESMVVAEATDGTVAGFAYLSRSDLHPSRYWATVRVREDLRRTGIGCELAMAIAKTRAEPLPLYAKLREGNPAIEWVESLGGREFQRSPAMKLDLRDPATLAWLEALPGAPSDIELVDGHRLCCQERLESWCGMYVWTHEEWSPVSSPEYVKELYRQDLAEDLDLDLSTFAVRRGPAPEVIAAAFVFQTPRMPAGEPQEPLDAVAETIAPDVPGGQQALAACLRATAFKAAPVWETLGLDGFETDGHLYPLVSTAPKRMGSTLLWMEYDPK